MIENDIVKLNCELEDNFSIHKFIWLLINKYNSKQIKYSFAKKYISDYVYISSKSSLDNSSKTEYEHDTSLETKEQIILKQF
jgi:hypothetical protein